MPATTASMAAPTAGVNAGSNVPDACNLVLAPQRVEGPADREIARLQAEIRAGKNPMQALERLGWKFVAKARESFDPGYYKLAEQCALCLDSRQPHCAEALLLRGHVLQNLHQFKAAQPLAEELVARRGLSFDYGLLGDVLMEQGRLAEAAEAYQKMVNQKPELEAYARIAHLRWLTGDLAGAKTVMELATGAASPNAPEAAAWVNTRLAVLQLQSGEFAEASQTCAAALEYQKDYAPSLLLRGRLLLADGKADQAIEALQRAVQLNPLPDCQWVLSEGLRAAGREEEARAVETQLARQGAAADPRTFALYLATRGESPALALQLAQDELSTRADVFTHDALAWSLAANGRSAEAHAEMQQALAEGTQDARLYLHATVIAAEAGYAEEAQQWMDKATGLLHLLLPSEQKQLFEVAIGLGQADLGEPDPASETTTLSTLGN